MQNQLQGIMLDGVLEFLLGSKSLALRKVASIAHGPFDTQPQRQHLTPPERLTSPGLAPHPPVAPP